MARLLGSFPQRLAPDVVRVTAMLAPTRHEPSDDDIGPIVVQGEALRIPMRIYFPELSSAELHSLTADQLLITHCLFSRHHDGHVREQAAKNILARNDIWTSPFVLQLLGEYVIEIVLAMEQRITSQHRQIYKEFLAQNSPFRFLIRSRIISYWNCYYRTKFWSLEIYPAMRLFTLLETGNSSYETTRLQE